MEIMNLAFSEDGKKVPGAKWTLVKSDRMRRRWKGLTGGFGFRGSVRSNSFSCFWVWTTSKMQVADSDPKCLPLKWSVCVFFFFFEVELIYDVVFISAIQQSDSWLNYTYMYAYTIFFFFCNTACVILVSQLGIKPVPPAVEVKEAYSEWCCWVCGPQRRFNSRPKTVSVTQSFV